MTRRARLIAAVHAPHRRLYFSFLFNILPTIKSYVTPPVRITPRRDNVARTVYGRISFEAHKTDASKPNQ